VKVRNLISSLIFGSGCALSFVGILALILPQLPLPQLQLVLASFSMSSENAAVSVINAFMSFVLNQSWQTFATGLILTCAGGWLLFHFSPKPVRTSEKADACTSPETAAVQSDSVPESNPFAVERTQESFWETQAVSSFTHKKPILEPNRIDEEDTAGESEMTAMPYISTRFAEEMLAIETESGQPSQSGSRILIRTSFEPQKKEPPPPAEAIKPQPQPVVRIAADPKPIPLQTSSRIRSTMGRHSAAKHNLPLRHS